MPRPPSVTKPSLDIKRWTDNRDVLRKANSWKICDKNQFEFDNVHVKPRFIGGGDVELTLPIPHHTAISGVLTQVSAPCKTFSPPFLNTMAKQRHVLHTLAGNDVRMTPFLQKNAETPLHFQSYKLEWIIVQKRCRMDCLSSSFFYLIISIWSVFYEFSLNICTLHEWFRGLSNRRLLRSGAHPRGGGGRGARPPPLRPEKHYIFRVLPVNYVICIF